MANYDPFNVAKSYLMQYSQSNIGDPMKNPFHQTIAPRTNRFSYEVDFAKGIVRNIQGRKYVGLQNSIFGLKESINLVHPALQNLMVKLKMETHTLMRDAAKMGELSEEEFLRTMIQMSFPVRIPKPDGGYRYVSANQTLQVLEYDTGFNVRAKSVEISIDDMTKIVNNNALRLSEEIKYSFYRDDGQNIQSLNNRLKKAVFNSYEKISEEPFPNRMGDVIDQFLLLSKTDSPPTAKKIARELGITKHAVRWHFGKIKKKAKEIIEDILPKSSTEWENNTVTPYIQTLSNLGVI